jgi:hypothetical protein
MPYVEAAGARLYFEEHGQGYPLIFVHEFGSDSRGWEDQVRCFSLAYRCIEGRERGFRRPSRRTAMSKHDRSTRAGHDRASLYIEITDKIIAELEAGRVPWVQPWGTAAVRAPLAMPRNATTQRRYSGINVLILWGAVIERGFSGQSWLTFRQALGLGGHVRKGERGTTVVYADRFAPEDERRRAAETGEEPGAIPFLKRFTVFNTDRCDGLPEDVASSVVPPPPGQIEPRAEALIAATGADCARSNAACLCPRSLACDQPPRGLPRLRRKH